MEGDLERYESEVELQLYREYRDVLPMFRFAIETERRFYLANKVDLTRSDTGSYFELELQDAWVWDQYRHTRFLSRARVLTFRDVSIEEVQQTDMFG